MKPRGYNPIKWDCMISGCYNYHRHYDIEVFAQCFPRSIGLTDLDGFVEINHHFLITEFKDRSADLTAGQRLAFERFSAISDRITIIVVRCDYKSSEVYSHKIIKKGISTDWIDIDYDRLIAKVKGWSDRVSAQPAKPTIVADNTERGAAA